MKVGNKDIKYLYVATTHDKYEFPIAVADSIYELSILTGLKPNALSQSISQHRPFYYKIDVSMEE